MNIILANNLKRVVNTFRLVFFFLGLGMILHYFKKRKTWKRLAHFAKDRGIKHVPSNRVEDFGELHWEVEGRPVIARMCYDNPSFGPWISVGLNLNTEILNLRTYKPLVPPNLGWEQFHSPSRGFDYLYKTREIKSDYKEGLLGSPEFFDDVVKFCYTWMLYMSTDIGTNGLDMDGKEIRFIFGPSPIRSSYPYITPEEIDSILPDMIRLAEKFDSLFETDGPKQADSTLLRFPTY